MFEVKWLKAAPSPSAVFRGLRRGAALALLGFAAMGALPPEPSEGEAFIGDEEPIELANIERSCDGSYIVEVTKVGSLKVDKSSGIVAGGMFGKFSARRGCGKTVPNRCRERAREAIFTCGQVHWDTKADRKAPSHCSSPEGISGYNVQNIQREVEKAVCCDPIANEYAENPAQVRLSVISAGDKGCGPITKLPFMFEPGARRGSKVIAENITIQCNKLREAGACK